LFCLVFKVHVSP